MKKIFLTLVLPLMIVTVAKTQNTDRFSLVSTIGAGIAISTPESTPFTWQVSGYYNFNQRFSVGAGLGISVYEKTLIPLFASIKLNITKPRKFTPYLECGTGYSFAPGKHANGGFYLNPSVGVQWAFFTKIKLLLAVGYELQQLERLKRYDNLYFGAEFKEQLHHNSISIRIGILF